MHSEKESKMDSQSHINKPEINMLLMKYVQKEIGAIECLQIHLAELFSSVCLENNSETTLSSVAHPKV